MSLFSHMQKASFLMTRLICLKSEVNNSDSIFFSDFNITEVRNKESTTHKLLLLLFLFPFYMVFILQYLFSQLMKEQPVHQVAYQHIC